MITLGMAVLALLVVGLTARALRPRKHVRRDPDGSTYVSRDRKRFNWPPQ